MKPHIEPVCVDDQVVGYSMIFGNPWHRFRVYWSKRYGNVTLTPMSKSLIINKEDIATLISFLERVPH